MIEIKNNKSTLDTTITKSVIILFTLMKQQTTTTYEMKRLKIKCSVHPNFSKIPPQEHGINELKFKIKIIYVVKQSLSPLINKGPLFDLLAEIKQVLVPFAKLQETR
jgi:hypothetical protein